MRQCSRSYGGGGAGGGYWNGGGGMVGNDGIIDTVMVDADTGADTEPGAVHEVEAGRRADQLLEMLGPNTGLDTQTCLSVLLACNWDMDQAWGVLQEMNGGGGHGNRSGEQWEEYSGSGAAPELAPEGICTPAPAPDLPGGGLDMYEIHKAAAAVHPIDALDEGTAALIQQLSQEDEAWHRQEAAVAGVLQVIACNGAGVLCVRVRVHVCVCVKTCNCCVGCHPVHMPISLLYISQKKSLVGS